MLFIAILYISLLCAWYGKFVIHKIFQGAFRSRKLARSVILRKVRIFCTSAPPPARSGLILFHTTAEADFSCSETALRQFIITVTRGISERAGNFLRPRLQAAGANFCSDSRLHAFMRHGGIYFCSFAVNT